MNRLSDTDSLDIEASDSIDAQAASWFARNREDTGRADRKAFAAWYAVPAHARAYAEFEQLWADLAQLQQLNKPVALAPRKSSPWRPALAVAAAVLCAVMATHLGTPRELYHTQVAAQAKGTRTLNLPDGSTLYVNTNTRLRVDFSAHQRIVHLDQGQLYIEVAADKERPLFVQAGKPACGWSAPVSMCAAARNNWWSALPTVRSRSNPRPEARSPCSGRSNAPVTTMPKARWCNPPHRRNGGRLAQRAPGVSQSRAGQPDRRSEPVPPSGTVAGQSGGGAVEGIGQPGCE